MTTIYTEQDLSELAQRLHTEIAKIEASDVSTFLNNRADKYNYFLFEDEDVDSMGYHTFQRFKHHWNLCALERDERLGIQRKRAI